MVRDEYVPGMGLQDYAERWVDMAPHLEQLTELARYAKTVVEFGVRGAVSSWAILDGLPEDGRLIAIDIDPDCPIPPRVKEDPRFLFVCGDDREVPLPDHADLVMIDSSHEYEHTVEELQLAASMQPDVIALHDYEYPDTPAVKRAVDEFVEANGVYRLSIVYPSYWGLAILSKD